MHTRHLMLMIALTVLLLGCAVGPRFTRPTPSVPAQWSSSSTAPAGSGTSQSEGERVFRAHARRSEVLAGEIVRLS